MSGLGEILDRKFRAPLDHDDGWRRGVLVGVAMVKASLRKVLNEQAEITPMLLEALQDLVREYEGYFEGSSEPECLIAARDIIAKAGPTK
jgi:hypothetical protein